MTNLLNLTESQKSFLADKIYTWLEKKGVKFNSPVEIEWIDERFGLLTAGCAWDDRNDKLRTAEIAFRGHPVDSGIIEDLEFSTNGTDWSTY